MSAKSVLPAPFEATRWSLVLRAREENSTLRRRALEELCAAYWYPLYAFLRRSGRGRWRSCAGLMDGMRLSAANPEKGKFRTLLLALKNMDANAWLAARAQKRGGGSEVVPLDAAMAEDRWQAEPAGVPAEAAFDLAWAKTVMDQAGTQLQTECVGGKGRALFRIISPPQCRQRSRRTGRSGGPLGKSETAVKMALSRMRPRYADALKAEISQTVGSHGDVQEELRYLLTVFL